MNRLTRNEQMLKELARNQKETDRLFKKLSKNVSGLNRSFGKIPEALSELKIENRFSKVGFEDFKFKLL